MTPLHRLEWEHIQQALSETGGNGSATTRLLGMHRRSLQRKLAKPGPRGEAQLIEIKWCDILSQLGGADRPPPPAGPAVLFVHP